MTGEPRNPSIWAMSISRRRLGYVLTTLTLTGIGRSLFGEDSRELPADGQTPGPSGTPQEGGQTEEQQPARSRLREGTKVHDLVGTVGQTGRRFTFFVDTDGTRFVLLENLMLERILRSQAAHPGTVRWRISGAVTEFQGQNYLLIDHALLHGRLEEENKPSTSVRNK